MLRRFTLLGLVNVDSLGYDSGFGVPLADAEAELSKNMDLGPNSIDKILA